MATTCFCPSERVNWDKPGGLCLCNWPCGTKEVIPFYNWYVDDTKETDVIIIPDKAVFFPSWILAFPCFCLNVCIMLPLMEANIFKIYEKNGNLTMDYLSKSSCSESIKYSRKKLSSASLDAVEAGIFTSRKLRISLLSDNGMVPDKGQWLIMNSQFNELVLKQCVDLINSKIARMNERKDNAAFAQQAYGISQQQPLAYGQMQPQLQLQQEVYFLSNLQPQPQPQIGNENAAFITYSVPQLQQPVYDFSQPQPLAYVNTQPQLQLQPQVYFINNSQPQPQPQIANDNGSFIAYSVPQLQQPVYDFSQPQQLVQPQVYFNKIFKFFWVILT